MACISPYIDKDNNEFPCGQCMPCRVKRTLEWTMRLCHERNTFIERKETILFATLTYKDDYLPPNKKPENPKNEGLYSLEPRDLQLFLKRLRRSLEKEDRQIRFYACGEYGERTGRPHYHLILFGMSKFKMETGESIYQRRKIRYHDQELIKKCWGKADIYHFGEGYDEKVMQYTSGYIQKKLMGKKGRQAYEEAGLIAPFMRCSKGIGRDYLLTHLIPAGIQETCEIEIVKIKKLLQVTPIRVKQKVGVPRYYRKIAGITTEQVQAKSAELRAESLTKLKKEGVITDMEGLKTIVPDYMLPSYKQYWDKYGTLPSIKEAEKIKQQIAGATAARLKEMFKKPPKL